MKKTTPGNYDRHDVVLPTGYSFGTPQADQYAPQVPPPPTTPGTAPLGFAPATTPTQDLSKAPTGQPDFPYSQYGKKSIVHKSVCCPFLSYFVFIHLSALPMTLDILLGATQLI